MNPYAENPSEHGELLSNAMESNWKEVIDIYKIDLTARTAKISRSGDTALHLAVSDGQESTVEQLVNIVDAGALAIQNDLGNMPLHLAAYMGNVRMCHCIASRNSELIGECNKGDETPLFLAVVHGRKEAFHCMHSFCEDKRRASKYCRKKDETTILHAAIAGEHFELAFQIIHLYPDFQNWPNEHGFTPLHLLATKPSVFKSGSHMNFLHKLVYDGIQVRKLKYRESPRTSLGHRRQQSNITSALEGSTGPKKDPEKQQLFDEKAMVPENYSTCFLALRLIFKPIGVFFGLDSTKKGKIREAKEKHIWSLQIMEEMVKNRKPKTDSSKKDGENMFGTGFSLDEVKLTEPLMDHDDQSQQPADLNSGTARNGKKEETPRVTKKGMEETVKNVLANFGVATNNDEKKKDKALMENEKKESASLTAANHGIIELMADKIFENFKSYEEKKEASTIMENVKNETALLIAAKHGIIEMVEKILKTIPMAIHDENSDGKNIVLLAVENRQPHLYQFLLERKTLKETMFYKRDKDGNSALHLAAKLGNRKSWVLPGPALHMQWEVKWYEFVETSMPPNFFVRHNSEGETAWEIFRKTHEDLVTQANDWLNKTSQSCSIVAVLIATVAFTTSAAVPGGVNSASGRPVLSSQPAFNIFAMASLLALCFSIASVVMFMVFFTSRYRERDFGTDLPTKLLVELTSLLIAIAAVLVSFSAGHFFVIKESFKYTAFSLYAATLFPVAIYAFWQIPVYTQYAKATWNKVPQKIYDQD